MNSNQRALAVKIRQGELEERFWKWRTDGRWAAYAACAGHDTNGFFPERTQYRSPRVVEFIDDNCTHCPVRKQCLTDALAERGTWGIFGGMFFPSAILTFDADAFERELIWDTYAPNIREDV